VDVPDWFPNLKSMEWEETSPIDPRYNCIAYAYGITDQFLWPTIHPQHQWPAGVRNDESVDAFRELYAKIGYTECLSGVPEAGFDKVAIFAYDSGEPTHAAIYRDGKWRSKLGAGWDISHDLDGLKGLRYGSPVLYLKRPTVPS